MKFLIVDLNIKLDGHRYGFMNNLLQYAGIHLSQDSFLFLTNLSSEFTLKSDYSNIQTLTLNSQEQKAIDEVNHLIKRAKIEWEIITKYAINHYIDRVILMYFDNYQIEIGKKNTPFKISGIWFAPYSRITAEHNTIKSHLYTFILKSRKKFIMQWALRNASLDKVFILNDEEMPQWLNGRFFTLPDPYFENKQLRDFSLRKKYNIPDHHKIYLQFGYIDERKNIENILHSFNLLTPDIQKQTTLLIIGKFKEGIKEQMLQIKTGFYQMILKDEFVSDEEMESTFAQSDVILRMNVNFFGSSGIVGIAAYHNKPVIASDKGLMAEIIKKYQLGKTVDPFDINKIAEAVTLFQNQSIKIDGSIYRESHDLTSFAKTLLSY